MELIYSISDSVNSFVWGVPTLALLIGTGIFVTVRLNFLQFTKFGYIMKNTLGKLFVKKTSQSGTLTPIQALTTALAGTVGTGNIAGVAGAISMGGPGAIFWMWIAALFGMCTKYAEIILAVHYREVNDKGDFVGGPMYYIQKWSWREVEVARHDFFMLWSVCCAWNRKYDTDKYYRNVHRLCIQFF